MKFYQELQKQRWDDHRYYHQSRINQSLHLLSALTFLASYIMLFFDPAMAVLLGWIVAMVLRQSGHFFFEPKQYDKVNEATHEYKEQIKVGYNLKRKYVLMTLWVAIPPLLYWKPDLFGMLPAYSDIYAYFHNLGMAWLALAVAALLFRTVHLFFIANVQSGLVWLTKILTDPFHDVKMYYKSPLHLLKGELLDPMEHVKSH